MRLLYHIVSRQTWEQLGTAHYEADSLRTEGFIHCSYAEQVAWVANTFYATATDLVVLCVAAERLASPVRDEDPGCGQKFPHVYGPIEKSAVVAVRPLQRDGAGHWLFAAEPGS